MTVEEYARKICENFYNSGGMIILEGKYPKSLSVEGLECLLVKFYNSYKEMEND